MAARRSHVVIDKSRHLDSVTQMIAEQGDRSHTYYNTDRYRSLSALKHALYATKTIRIRAGMFDRTEHLFPANAESIYRTCLLQCRMHGELGPTSRHGDSASMLLLNLVNAIYMQVGTGNSFKPLSTWTASNVTVTSTWLRGGKYYQYGSPIKHMLLYDHPLTLKDPLWSLQKTETQTISWDEHFPLTLNMGCDQRPYKNFTGIRKGLNLHPHILFYVERENNVNWDFILGHAVWKSFTLTHAWAVEHLQLSPSDLLEAPVCLKTLATDGCSLFLIWYQLNTLDLDSDVGRKNLVSIRRSPMFFGQLLDLDRKYRKYKGGVPELIKVCMERVKTQYEVDAMEKLSNFLFHQLV